MAEKTKKQSLALSEERIKFYKNLMGAWVWYKFDFYVWRNEMRRIKKDYNGFGIKLPDMCIDPDDLFKNFIEVEMKKPKNKKHKQLLSLMFEDYKNYITSGEI
jgi:hypothetical protein